VIVIYKAAIISFLWLNVIGALLVIITGIVFQVFFSASQMRKIKMPPQ
jgi:cytochrome b subunit of formate dehydrogenase